MIKITNKILAISVALLSINTQPFSAIPQETSSTLTALSQTFTNRFLKNGYTQSDINNFIAYIKSSGIKSAFYVYTFKNGTWHADPVVTERKDSYPHTRFANELLTWLNTHIKKDIKDGLSFIYMPQEPLHECGFLDQKQQLALKTLFEKCPILLTCTHPNILWADQGILIPDPYILLDKYKTDIEEIKAKKELIYSKRSPSIFFRGAISGPYSYIYNTDSIYKDDRVKLFSLSKSFPFINALITDDSCLTIHGRVTADFQQWYSQNLSDKKGPYANFIEHARHKYLISIDGYGSAWSRVPYILFTGSVLLLRADCKQYFYSLLQNMTTHVNIDLGLVNLAAVYIHLEQNPHIAESIGNNGYAFAEKYLTVDAINMYLVQVIRDLNDAFKPPMQQ